MILLLTFETDGDRDRFEYLYEKYKRLLMHKAYTILRDHSLAEDAVSEAFMRVYRNLHKIDEPDSGRTAAFLVTIVKNTAINLYHKKAGTESFDDIEPFAGADSFNMEESVADRDAARQIYKIVDTLKEDLKSVFLLKYAHDLSHKEIGKILNITENNVNVRLHRAKKKLAELIKQAR